MNGVHAALVCIIVAHGVSCAGGDHEHDRVLFLKTSWDPYLQSLDEAGLCELRRSNGQTYRLIHERPFELPTIIVLEIPDDGAPIVTKKTGRTSTEDDAGTILPDTTRSRLERNDVEDVLRQLQGIDFWRAETEPQTVEDGTFVYLEGVRDGSCHYLLWISPQEEEVKELLNSLFALTRLKDEKLGTKGHVARASESEESISGASGIQKPHQSP